LVRREIEGEVNAAIAERSPLGILASRVRASESATADQTSAIRGWCGGEIEGGVSAAIAERSPLGILASRFRASEPATAAARSKVA
jgi:hypothetical protein